MRTCGAGAQRFMHHFFKECDYGAGRVVILIPAIDIYGNKIVNTIETKPLCASSSNLADMLAIGRDFGGQRSRSQ